MQRSGIRDSSGVGAHMLPEAGAEPTLKTVKYSG